jgi:formate hydrogenlyase subunit 6/NADH:ubiquinone oxidoreductase subunit I
MTHKCVSKGTCVDICPPKPVHHSKSYQQGYRMGCSDGPIQIEQLVKRIRTELKMA